MAAIRKQIGRQPKSKFPCPHSDCAYAGASRTHLTIHIRRMHEAKSERPYACKFCPSKFVTLTSLGYHISSHTGEKPIKCDWPECTYRCTQPKNLSQHLLTHTNERKFSCNFPGCTHKSKTPSAIKMHITSCHSSEKPFKCPNCPYKAKMKFQVTKHWNEVHSDVKRFECPEPNCGAAFKRSEGLKGHQKKCHPIDGQCVVQKILCTFDPPHCSFETLTEASMKKHVMHRHTKEKPFECALCPFKSANATYVKRHMVVHTGERPFVCQVCKLSFAFVTNLRDHHLAVHKQEKRFGCKFCKSTFFTNSQLTKHMRMHTGEKPEECEICHIFFGNKTTLGAHLKVHSGEKNFVCTICEKKCSRSHALKEHMRIHDNEKPFECRLCDVRCRTSGALTSHVRGSHTNERPEKCKLCQKSFGNKHMLNLHMRIHTGEKPYACQLCSYSSRTGGGLTSHLAHVHDNKKEQQVADNGGGGVFDGVVGLCRLCGFRGSDNGGGADNLNEHFEKEHSKIPFVLVHRLNF